MSKLATDNLAQDAYEKTLGEKITTSRSHQHQISAVIRWQALTESIKSAARETVGTIDPKVKRDETLDKLSEEQKHLRVEMNNSNCPETKRELKTERNKVMNKIHEHLKKRQIEELESKTSEIESLKDGARMFQAVRELTRSKPTALIVKNKDGEVVAQPEEAAEQVAGHFKSLFFDEQMSANEQDPKIGPLNNQITNREVERALRKLKNGRATGPDGIPGELLKYSDPLLHQEIAEKLNIMLENGEDFELGKGTLIVLPKPGKPPGEMSSLRPIVLLNTIRKTLSPNSPSR